MSAAATFLCVIFHGILSRDTLLGMMLGIPSFSMCEFDFLELCHHAFACARQTVEQTPKE